MTPINAYGEGATGTLDVMIQTPVAPQVALEFTGETSDGKACEDEDELDVTVDLLNSNGGSGVEYQFFIGNSAQNAPSTFTSMIIPQGSWSDGDRITVQMTPHIITGCFTGSGGSVTSAPVIIDGMDCGPVGFSDVKTEEVVFYPNPASQSIQLSKEF